MKVLSIGNSFSQDAHKWLCKLAQGHDIDLEIVNLYIGGCSLETHWKNVQENAPAYELQPNGEPVRQMASIQQALEMEKWDVVTLQQVSQFSGMPETYEPYLTELAALVRQNQPQAKLYFHQTWAYEIDSNHSGFANYDCNQSKMYANILTASEAAAASINAEMIPVGTVIQHLRERIPEFDYKNGGLSLCRDGFHLSRDYGRYAAAATWLRILTGVHLHPVRLENCDPELLSKITAEINRLV